MQGRLSPPVNKKIQAFPLDTWEQEFQIAKEVGLEQIDWIVEADNFSKNPLLTTEGSTTIKTIISNTGVSVVAVCADYFMDCPLIRCSELELKERLTVMEFIIERLHFFGIKYLEIPFVDNSAIKNRYELSQIVQIMKPILNKAYLAGVTLAFETSLPPLIFRDFLIDLNHPSARANYDMGNSASLGYDPREELESYGEKVVTVHIKDRIMNGNTVPLGEGDTDFTTCFELFKKLKFTGPYILQVARGGEEIEWTRKNLTFVQNFIK